MSDEGQLFELPVLEDAVESYEAVDSENETLRAAAQVNVGASPATRLVGLELENFKGFVRVRLRLSDFNVLVGTNNSGKSTLLQAIKLGQFLIRQHFQEGLKPRPGRYLPEAVLPVAEPRDLWYRKQWRIGNTPAVCRMALEFADGSRFEFGLRLIFGAVNSKLLSAPEDLDVDRLNGVLSLGPVLVPSSVGIVTHEESRNPARVNVLVQTGRQNETLRNILHDLQLTQPDRFAYLCALVSQHFVVDLQEVRFEPSTDQFIDARYDENGADLDLFSAGAGLLQVVQLLAFALRGQHGMILLDEPDAHLHSSMQLIVVDMLEQVSRRYGFQVVISTHSKEIINFVAPELLIPVTEAESLEPLAPHSTAIAILSDLGTIDNVDLYSLFLGRRAAFIEGPSDRKFLIRIASTLASTVFEGDSRVVLVPTGGVDNFPAALAVGVFHRLANVDIRYMRIRDRDGLPDDKRAALMGEDVTLHVYERDCIESYFVQPSAFARVVAAAWEAQEREGSPPDVSEMEALVDRACEDLKDDTTDRISNALDAWYSKRERRFEAPGTLNAAARQVRDDAWPTREGRMRFVPGKQLLAKCRDLVKSTYNVSLSERAIVEACDVETDLAEIVDLVRRAEAL
jgi:predicted ATPase